MAPTLTTSGTNGVHHAADEAIDSLYAWFPPQPSAPAPCPEAAFSLTLKGCLDGQEALLTVRGQTATEFKTNLQAIRGLLDQPQRTPPAQPASQGPNQGQDKGWCSKHGVQMRHNHKEGRSWWSPNTADGWCKGTRFAPSPKRSIHDANSTLR